MGHIKRLRRGTGSINASYIPEQYPHVGKHPGNTHSQVCLSGALHWNEDSSEYQVKPAKQRRDKGEGKGSS